MKHCPRPLRVKRAGRITGVICTLLISFSVIAQPTSIRNVVDQTALNIATDAPSVDAGMYGQESLGKLSPSARTMLPLVSAANNSVVNKSAVNNTAQGRQLPLSDFYAIQQSSTGQVEADLLVAFSSTPDQSLLRAMGGEVVAVSANIAAIRLPIASIATLAQEQSVTYIDISRRMRPMSADAQSVDHARVRSILKTRKRAGEDVLIGIVDTGIDHTHPDLSGSEGSAILRLWDMSDVDNANAPTDIDPGFNWGRQYTKEEIDADPDQVIQLDGDGGLGHGTHISGIAAGLLPNESTDAPLPANLIVVKAVRGVESEGGFSEADVLAAIDYIFKQAEAMGKPAVVNLSMGHYDGPLDGTSLFDQAITEMMGPGRLIVAASGNGGFVPIHAGQATAGEEIYEAFLQTKNAEQAQVNLWYTPESIGSVALAFYSEAGGAAELLGMTDPLSVGQVLGSTSPVPLEIDGMTLGYVSIDAANIVDLNNGDGQISISLTNNGDDAIDLQQTLWSVVTTGTSLGHQDMWVSGGEFRRESLSTAGVIQLFGNSERTIASPATADGVVAVGSYVSQNRYTNVLGLEQQWLNPSADEDPVQPQLGQRSYFSGNGPTRDGRMAPDLMAPGEVVLSLLSSHLTIGKGYVRDEVLEGGNYRAFEGTSVAAAMVTNVAAQMLEAYPDLNPTTFKFLLQDSATPDFQTGSVPNNEFGAGKINGPEAIQRAAELGSSTAAASIDRAGISLGVPPGIQATSQFVLENNGTGELTYELVFDDLALANVSEEAEKISNIRSKAIDEAPRPTFDQETIASLKQAAEVPASKGKNANSFATVLGKNVLMHDDGNHTPDVFWGFGEPNKKVFWGNQYILEDFDFTLEKIQFYTRTESLIQNILWVGVYKSPFSLQLFGGRLFGIEANEEGQWYEIELETPISFSQGSGFFIELTASDSLQFPVAVDFGSSTSDRSFFSSLNSQYANINTLTSSGIEQGAMLVRAVGTASRNINLPPVASAVLSSMRATQGEQITFDASPSEDPDGELVSVAWDFGDGNTSELIETTHAYDVPGDYNVKLVVRDNSEAESVAHGKVTVMPADPLSSPRLTVTPTVGTIAPGTSQVFDVVYSTSDLEEGVYDGRIDVSTNAGYLSLPISVEVSQTFVSNEDELVLPDEIWLDQNYPNPFKPETVIAYNLPEPYNVTLEVYDTMGRRVGILDRGMKSAGRYEVLWNATDDAGNPVASGIYFYRLSARSVGSNGTQQLHKKMILLR